MIPFFDFGRDGARSGKRFAVCLVLALLSSVGFAQQPDFSRQTVQGNCTEIERKVPPVGLDISDDTRSQYQQPIAAVRRAMESIPVQARPDVEVFLKACEFALKYRELYKPTDLQTVAEQTSLAEQRVESARSGQTPWTRMHGMQVRGYRSSVDGSVQPIGLEFGSEISDSSESIPLYVWLHGRGDKVTDLHFIRDRLAKRGKFVPKNAIVMHPFGRQCIGYKSAGEIDVMEAIDFVCEEYPIDESRIVLMGFSMGGAGVWHLAAHYGERFIAASPGAGFAETARYQRLKPESFPAKHVQMLWGIYDVPGYVRNLFNLPVIAYSGENDKQIQAARVMEQAYESEGRSLTHLIGPGMGHKYHPDTLAEILRRMDAWVETPDTRARDRFSVQTKHWRYGGRNGVSIDGMVTPYEDTRVDVESQSSELVIQTKNVSRLTIDRTNFPDVRTLRIDSQDISANADSMLLARGANGWTTVSSFPERRKRSGLSGPIDDAFLSPFLVVLPSGRAESPGVEQWIQCEYQLFKMRWESLFRGKLRVILDKDVTSEDMERFNLVCWGTTASNSVLGAAFEKSEFGRIRWKGREISVVDRKFDSRNSVLAMIYPNPLQPARYLVVNSGPTFRPAHDRTNSLQNPQLPDWVVFQDLQTRNAESAGKIANCGFFDDRWQLSDTMTW